MDLKHVVDKLGVAVNPDKAAAICAALSLKAKQVLKSWICTAHYNVDFCPGFGMQTAPLNKLT